MANTNSEKSRELKRILIDMSAGGIAGAMSRTVTSPLDVIKIRFQVQLEPTSSWALNQDNCSTKPKYNGLLRTTCAIFREEGLRGFWRGNVPALLMYVQYSAIQFAVLSKLKSLALSSEDHAVSPYLSYISGSLGGCAATVGSYPCDLMRTILGSQGEPKVYPNMRSACVSIFKTRGIKGLYAGLSPTLIQIVPYAGLQFGTYDTFKRWSAVYNKRHGSINASGSLSKSQLFLCGLASGTVSKVVCHPLDVVKKRYQVEGLQRDPKYGARVEVHAYKNMFDALGQIARSEGWNGLYKGIVPSTIKAAPAAAVTFFTYELVSNVIKNTDKA